MPTPLDIIFDPISLTLLGLYAALMLWEAIAPGRPLPKIRGWKLKGLAAFTAFFFLSTYLPLLWDQYLARYQLVDLTSLHTATQVVIGLVVYELGAWAWHSSMHRFRPLWRMHQTHHSAERLDTYGAFYFHPLDMVGWTLLASVALVLGVGVSAQAATVLILILTFLGMFQHANIKTPRWLGYFVQRPESYTVHHGRAVHTKNFADLPVIDMCFGTFENPRGFEHETGLFPGSSALTIDLLLMRDVETTASVATRRGPARTALSTGEFVAIVDTDGESPHSERTPASVIF